jgi:hypothetical protein
MRVNSIPALYIKPFLMLTDQAVSGILSDVGQEEVYTTSDRNFSRQVLLGACGRRILALVC